MARNVFLIRSSAALFQLANGQDQSDQVEKPKIKEVSPVYLAQLDCHHIRAKNSECEDDSEILHALFILKEGEVPS